MKLSQLILNEVEKHFEIDEIKVITINSYNDYKEGMYWDNLDEFVNDDEIKVNDLFVESYTAYIMNDIEDYEYDFDIHERMEELYKNEDYFIILDEIVLNKLSK